MKNKMFVYCIPVTVHLSLALNTIRVWFAMVRFTSCLFNASCLVTASGRCHTQPLQLQHLRLKYSLVSGHVQSVINRSPFRLLTAPLSVCFLGAKSKRYSVRRPIALGSPSTFKTLNNSSELPFELTNDRVTWVFNLWVFGLFEVPYKFPFFFHILFSSHCSLGQENNTQNILPSLLFTC